MAPFSHQMLTLTTYDPAWILLLPAGYAPHLSQYIQPARHHPSPSQPSAYVVSQLPLCLKFSWQVLGTPPPDLLNHNLWRRDQGSCTWKKPLSHTIMINIISVISKRY